MSERKGEVKQFGASCKTFAKAASEARKPAEPPKPPTTDEKVDILAQNMTNLTNAHANAINALAMWIEKNDTKVAKAGGIVQWAVKEQAKAQRLAERKSEYQRTRKG